MGMFPILGFPTPASPTTWTLNNISKSQMPIRLSGPTCIHVNTNLPLFNIPTSGRLATIGVSVNYGELLLYFDESNSQPVLLTSQFLDYIRIQLTDENNEELECYDHLPWQCVISIDPIEGSGYESMTNTLNRPNIEESYSM